MNALEVQMLEMLKKGREYYGYVGVKAEFEAEGTRIDELLRLVEIARKADLKIGLKIGGCEAIKDLLESKQIGVDYIIAPMIESPYALSKYIQAKNQVYSAYERAQTKFLFNLETTAAYQAIDKIVEQAIVKDGVDGIVFGRVDYTLSKGLSRQNIASEETTNECIAVAKLCHANHLEFVVGGAVAKESLPALAKINHTHLSRFETRKVIFSSDVLADEECAEEGLRQAVNFELLWLKNKRNYYSGIEQEDVKRIEMLEARKAFLQQQASAVPA